MFVCLFVSTSIFCLKKEKSIFRCNESHITIKNVAKFQNLIINFKIKGKTTTVNIDRYLFFLYFQKSFGKQYFSL